MCVRRDAVSVPACRRLIAGLMLALAIAASGQAQTIDRILAVIDADIITQSDVTGAISLGLVTPTRSPGEDPLRNALDLLIDRQLTLNEVRRYSPPVPTPAQIETKIDEIRVRLSAAGLERALAESGLTLEQLRREITENLRIEVYLQQRFGSAFQPPTDADVLEHYRTHQATLFPGEVPRRFSDVQDQVRAALVASRRAVQIRDWIEGLRRRANVSVLLDAK